MSMIYLDNNSTTSIDTRVFDAMESVYFSLARNPSSTHRYGQKAKALLAQATQDVANYFKVAKSEIFFTSGATEAINMFIKGIFQPPYKGHMITSTLEHVAVYNLALWLQSQGVAITFLSPAENRGVITQDQIEKALRPDTKLIALMSVNNETGCKTDLASIAEIAHAHHVPLFVDGVASLGKEPFLWHKGITAFCFSSHKIHGPLGVGLLLVKKGFSFQPLIIGGPQAHGMRGGTENLPAIVGFSKALELINNDDFLKIEALRDKFEKQLQTRFPDIQVNGATDSRICNTSNLYFPGIDGEMLLMQSDLAGVAASYGSACSSGSLEISRTLQNMGFPKERSLSSIRFSLSRLTTDEEIHQAIDIISKVVFHFQKLML